MHETGQKAASIFKNIKLNRDEKPTKTDKVLGRYACLASLTLAPVFPFLPSARLNHFTG